jgi:hypothetical protein
MKWVSRKAFLLMPKALSGGDQMVAINRLCVRRKSLELGGRHLHNSYGFASLVAETDHSVSGLRQEVIGPYRVVQDKLV